MVDDVELGGVEEVVGQGQVLRFHFVFSTDDYVPIMRDYVTIKQHIQLNTSTGQPTKTTATIHPLCP